MYIIIMVIKHVPEFNTDVYVFIKTKQLCLNNRTLQYVNANILTLHNANSESELKIKMIYVIKKILI